MSLTFILFLLPLHHLVFCYNSLNNANNSKLNIVIIIIDDLRHLSDQSVNLPNIRRMEEKGATFKNAFAQQALCAPSRNSLLTGRRPDSLRLYDFYSYWRDTVGNFTTLPQFFKENGYETYSVGKIFHPGVSSNFTDDYPYSWSDYPYHPPSERFKDAAVCKDNVTNKYQNNLICPVDVVSQPGKTLPDLESVKYAVNFLNNWKNDKPFLLAIGFHKPHIPLKFPKEYLDKIPLSNIHPPKYPYKPKNMPLVAWQPWTDVRRRDDIKLLNISFPLGTMPREWSLKIRQSYYAAASYIDDMIGLLVRHVDMRKTIIVLTSDHGWSLGENGLWAKYSNFDVALKVPLIFRAPNIRQKTILSPVELVDVFPTLVHLAGLNNHIPTCKSKMDKDILCFEGKSLVPFIMSNKATNAFAISQYPRPSRYPQKNSDKPRLKHIKIMGYSIMTKRYRYTEWISFNHSSFSIDWNRVYGIELYDHSFDSEESNNLHLVAHYKYIKYYLSKLLRSHVGNDFSGIV